MKEPILVRFENRPRPFLMLERFCDNPDCGCNEVLLEFVEFDEAGQRLTDSFEFGFWLNLETWQERGDPDRPKAADSLAGEFIRGMTGELKESFRRTHEQVTKKVRNAARFVMRKSDFERGQMVSYGDVFGDSGCLLSGGRGCSFRLVGEGKRYLIDDLYCINPRCKCRETLLVFFEYDEDKGVLSQIFDVIVAPGKKPRFDHHPAYTPEEVRDIFRRWRESDSGALEVLEARIGEMKQIGRRLAAKFRRPRGTAKGLSGGPARTGKPGRNDPCPCGSGKKYKRCCGAI